MTRRSPARRTVALAGAATLVAGLGLSALVGAASAAACPTWTDPTGDATTGGEPTGVAADAQMDITAASLGTVGDSLVATVTTDGLGDSSSDAGDEFGVRFTIAGQTVIAFADRTAPPLVGTVNASAGFLNETTETTIGDASAVYDVEKKTVTITGKLTELAVAVGAPVVGQAATGLEAYTSDIAVVFPVFGYDSAPTTLTHVVGQACQSGAPVPSASGTPAPPPPSSPAPSSSPSPSASPSSSPAPAPSGSASPAPGGAPATQLPRAGCVTFADATDDARALNANNPENDPALDLTGLVLQTTPTALVGWVKVAELADGPSASTDGARFSFRFTHNAHVFTAAGSTYNTAEAAQVRGTLSQTGQVGGNVQLSVDSPPLTDPTSRVNTGFVESGLTVAFDQTSSYVVVTVPIADVEKYGEKPLAGATLTAVDAISATDTGAVSSQVDQVTAATPETAVYRVGDNACFATRTVLTNAGATSGQFTDVAQVAVRLADANGRALAGQRVAVSLPGTTAFLTTGRDGVARLAASMRNAAGAGTLTASFAGTKDLEASALSVPFTVLLEKTALLATGSRGAVTATLRDDDRTPVAGQVLVLTQGSTKRSVRTDAKGTAKAGGFRPGQPVTVTYSGVAGRYAPTSLTLRP